MISASTSISSFKKKKSIKSKEGNNKDKSGNQSNRNKHTTERINNVKSLLLEKTDTTDKPLERIVREKGEG